MTSLVETTQAERESWAALDSVPDEDDLQRLISDADRAAEFESVMVEVADTLRPLLHTNAETPIVGARRCSRCGASAVDGELVWCTYPDTDWSWHCEDYTACAERAKKETDDGSGSSS